MMLRTLEKWVCFLGICLVFLCVCGCGTRPKTPQDYTAYMKHEINVCVRGELCRTTSEGYDGEALHELSGMGEGMTNTPVAFAAQIWVAEASSEQVQRDFTLIYTAPQASQGLTVTCQNGSYTLSLPSHGGQAVTFDVTQQQIAGLLRPLTALLPDGDMTGISVEEDGVVEVTFGADATGEKSENVLLFATDVQATKASLPMAVRQTDSHGWLNMRISVVSGGK